MAKLKKKTIPVYIFEMFGNETMSVYIFEMFGNKTMSVYIFAMFGNKKLKWIHWDTNVRLKYYKRINA